MEKIKVNYLFDSAVAQVILDDGKGNVLDQIMMHDLITAFEEFKTRSSLKLITFEGAGKHFSFGASVEEHQKENAAAMLKGFHRLFFSLMDMAIPTLAKISGQCLGGGMELAIMCNFLYADKGVKLGQPEVILGVFPPPASIILSEKIGLARADELIITGKVINAEHAKSIGLVNEVFNDKQELDAAVINFIELHILPKSACSLRFAVNASRFKFNHILSTYLPQLEQVYVHELMNTIDANEGITSFLEKRRPVWQNR
jgi:cyclohexa-1,5-dienecarbonyl-CoA hydratase